MTSPDIYARNVGKFVTPRMTVQSCKPLAIDLFCGLGGWTEGLLAEGYEVVGYDIEAHEYGEERYPGTLVLQDVLKLNGAQFKDAALIVASPPCQEYSYMAMPWTRAKQIAAALRGRGEFPERYTGSRTIPELRALFDVCFRIQREASEAAGHHIPLVVENVRGAVPWVGPAAWNYGSYYLWGDVPALMPQTMRGVKIGGGAKVDGIGWTGFADTGASWRNREQATKNPGFRFDGSGKSFQSESVNRRAADSFGWAQGSELRNNNSKSPARKAASARIAKIPLPLSQWIARTYKPQLAVAA